MENRREILIAELFACTYNCVVCFEKILHSESIWSCQKCYSVFHFQCITKWALSRLHPSTHYEEQETPPEKVWRCPGCQNPNENIPTKASCFCGSFENPESLILESERRTPHSCGGICGRLPKNSDSESVCLCFHPCQSPCHPGPCPPCLNMVVRSCACTRTKFVPCISIPETTCENVCLKTLPCGTHSCEEKCHEGACEPCVREKCVLKFNQDSDAIWMEARKEVKKIGRGERVSMRVSIVSLMFLIVSIICVIVTYFHPFSFLTRIILFILCILLILLLIVFFIN